MARGAVIATAAGVLLLSVVGCALTGSAHPTANQAATVPATSDTQSISTAAGGNAQSVGGSLEKRKPPTPTPRRTPTATPTRTSPGHGDGLPVIYVDQLPREARSTLRLIERDGPFPYDKDGAVFQNREGILPSRQRGYYREYTVITPGENDRGARRIVAGERGELYYTDDHYDSFKRITER